MRVVLGVLLLTQASASVAVADSAASAANPCPTSHVALCGGGHGSPWDHHSAPETVVISGSGNGESWGGIIHGGGTGGSHGEDDLPEYGPMTARCQRCRDQDRLAMEKAEREKMACARQARRWAENMVQNGHTRNSLAIRRIPKLKVERRCIQYSTGSGRPNIIPNSGGRCERYAPIVTRNPEFVQEVDKCLTQDPARNWSDPNVNGGADVAIPPVTTRFNVTGETRSYSIGQTMGAVEHCEAEYNRAFQEAQRLNARCRGGAICD
jgi:hypothetical protein